MAITLNDNVYSQSNKPQDAKYGPWGSVALATAGIPVVYRHLGLTVGIQQGSSVQEYWFKDGVQDLHLVLKQSTPQVVTVLGNVVEFSGVLGATKSFALPADAQKVLTVGVDHYAMLSYTDFVVDYAQSPPVLTILDPRVNPGLKYWGQVVSGSTSNPFSGTTIHPWAPGTYTEPLVYVDYQDQLYSLLSSVPRPFNSTDLLAELTAGSWQPVGGESTPAGLYPGVLTPLSVASGSLQLPDDFAGKIFTASSVYSNTPFRMPTLNETSVGKFFGLSVDSGSTQGVIGPGVNGNQTTWDQVQNTELVFYIIRKYPYGSGLFYYRPVRIGGNGFNKVDKVNGLGLSQNSFTTAEKTKLAGLSSTGGLSFEMPVVALGLSHYTPQYGYTLPTPLGGNRYVINGVGPGQIYIPAALPEDEGKIFAITGDQSPRLVQPYAQLGRRLEPTSGSVETFYYSVEKLTNINTGVVTYGARFLFSSEPRYFENIFRGPNDFVSLKTILNSISGSLTSVEGAHYDLQNYVYGNVEPRLDALENQRSNEIGSVDAFQTQFIHNEEEIRPGVEYTVLRPLPAPGLIGETLVSAQGAADQFDLLITDVEFRTYYTDNGIEVRVFFRQLVEDTLLLVTDNFNFSGSFAPGQLVTTYSYGTASATHLYYGDGSYGNGVAYEFEVTIPTQQVYGHANAVGTFHRVGDEVVMETACIGGLPGIFRYDLRTDIATPAVDAVLSETVTREELLLRFADGVDPVVGKTYIITRALSNVGPLVQWPEADPTDVDTFNQRFADITLTFEEAFEKGAPVLYVYLQFTPLLGDALHVSVADNNNNVSVIGNVYPGNEVASNAVGNMFGFEESGTLRFALGGDGTIYTMAFTTPAQGAPPVVALPEVTTELRRVGAELIGEVATLAGVAGVVRYNLTTNITTAFGSDVEVVSYQVLQQRHITDLLPVPLGRTYQVIRNEPAMIGALVPAGNWTQGDEDYFYAQFANIQFVYIPTGSGTYDLQITYDSLEGEPLRVGSVQVDSGDIVSGGIAENTLQYFELSSFNGPSSVLAKTTRTPWTRPAVTGRLTQVDEYIVIEAGVVDQQPGLVRYVLNSNDTSEDYYNFEGVDNGVITIPAPHQLARNIRVTPDNGTPYNALMGLMSERVRFFARPNETVTFTDGTNMQMNDQLGYPFTFSGIYSYIEFENRGSDMWVEVARNYYGT